MGKLEPANLLMLTRQRGRQLSLLSRILLALVAAGCATPSSGPVPAEPSANALEPTLDDSEPPEEVATPRSQIGPYLLIAPDRVALDDETGSLEVAFSVPCTNLQLDRVVVWGDGKGPAKAGVIYPESECRKGQTTKFERTISPAMTEYGALGKMEQPRVRAMASSEFQIVPAASVIIEPSKQATVSYAAPCTSVEHATVVTAWDPGAKAMAAAVLLPRSGCRAGGSTNHQLRYDGESDEYQMLGGGEKDLTLRPMWIK